jgi:hypothetical protein
MGDSFKGKIRVWNWGDYLFLEDWEHRLVLSSVARIRDPNKVPQPLYEIVADVDSDAVTFSDWMAGTNDVKGFFIEVRKFNFAKLDVIVDLRFRLVDFKVWFPTSKERVSYGFSNFFDPGLTPKAVVDAFWGGRNEDEIVTRLDVVVGGRLDNDKPWWGCELGRLNSRRFVGDLFEAQCSFSAFVFRWHSDRD